MQEMPLKRFTASNHDGSYTLGWDFFLKMTPVGRGTVLSPGNDTVWFAFEKTHSCIRKEGGWDKASQEAGRTFTSINVRPRGWCSGESSEVRQEGTGRKTTKNTW